MVHNLGLNIGGFTTSFKPGSGSGPFCTWCKILLNFFLDSTGVNNGINGLVAFADFF